MTSSASMTRRRVLAALAAGGAGSWLLSPQALATPPGASASARVVIVGGGMAGMTLAKYLRMWGNNLDVTLVDREASYTSCIMSSLVLTGQRSLNSLVFTRDKLVKKYGVKFVAADVSAVDPVGPSVTLADGTVLLADRVVLAPGIAFDGVPGLADPDRMPHAWKAGPQTTLLKNQLKAMPKNGVAVLTIPKTPYRCPPGPYERACLLADWMKKNKPQAKLLVLDANAGIVVEQDNFSKAFFELHGNVIDYIPNAEVLSADSTQMTLTTTQGTLHGDVINLIPRQRCGPIVSATGLANATEGRFAAVDVLSYQSTLAANVHILGDSSATTQPKAGHIANQEAKVCADALIRQLGGQSPDPAPVTNSACFSTITMKQASWLTALFQYDPASRTMLSVADASGASAGWSSENFGQMDTWFKALMTDTCG